MIVLSLIQITVGVAILSVFIQFSGNYGIAFAAAPDSSPEDFEREEETPIGDISRAPDSSPEDFRPQGEIPVSVSTGKISGLPCYKISEINNTASTTADVLNEQYSPNNIVDKNYTTFWIKNYLDPSAWLTIELEERTNICRIDVAWFNTTLADFAVYVSNNGTVFEPVASYVDNNIGETFFDKYLIPEVATKYVKLSFSPSTDAKIRELSIFTH